MGWIFKVFLPKTLSKIPTNSNTLFLTFDDGPIPEVTPYVLDTLKTHNIKATFFCVGENISKHPDIFQRIIDEGHLIGNHTYNHLNYLKTSKEEYLKNIDKCQNTIHKNTSKEFKPIFRPPYGKISKKMVNHLNEVYKIVLWDVLSGDFDPKLSSIKCLQKSIKSSSNGSIIVFHDNIKSFDTLKDVLPKYITHFKKTNYNFESLEKYV